ncbi:unnamed protein product [Moneuplotes crassus]|uniref:Uncharacterized protein n=1 Tax=Euplotes crassus TaxID=5936 RepID=A0AAD2D2U2_EUPCR|nr:unnamed protein product [Moneuplotes crassus]
MGSFLQKLIVLVLVVSIVTCEKGHLNRFRDDPTESMIFLANRLDYNLKIPLLFVNLMRMIELTPFDFIGIYSKATEFVKEYLKIIFDCTSLACVTPARILFRIMQEFRGFSRDMVTEIEYGFGTLKVLYAKKHLGVITKIIHGKGKDAFDDKSQCIRMRVGQFFMPTFKGNDTSNCTEFDEIIHSFSEQSEDFGETLDPCFSSYLY